MQKGKSNFLVNPNKVAYVIYFFLNFHLCSLVLKVYDFRRKCCIFTLDFTVNAKQIKASIIEKCLCLYFRNYLNSELSFFFFDISSTVCISWKISLPTQHTTCCVTHKEIWSDLWAGKQAPLLHLWIQTYTGAESATKGLYRQNNSMQNSICMNFLLVHELLKAHHILLVIKKSGAQSKVWKNMRQGGKQKLAKEKKKVERLRWCVLVCLCDRVQEVITLC